MQRHHNTKTIMPCINVLRYAENPRLVLKKSKTIGYYLQTLQNWLVKLDENVERFMPVQKLVSHADKYHYFAADVTAIHDEYTREVPTSDT